MYERGDAARAAFMFANGLLRDPDNEDALNWLLMLYVEKIEKPGMERDILRVLETQPDGLELFELIETRLAEQDRADKIEALRRMRDREGYLDEQPEPAEHEVPPAPEESNEQKSDDVPSGSDEDAQDSEERRSGSSRALDRESREWSDGTGSLGEAGEDAWREFEDPFREAEEEQTEGEETFRRTTATTGVYSSLNAISEEKAKRELREYYARKRKIQILFGLVIIAIVSAVLLFAFPQDESSGSAQTGENAPAEMAE
jgi:hypothetical protein